MKRLVIATALVAASAFSPAHADTDRMSRHQAGLYGTELYSIGEYHQAMIYLRAAVYGTVARPEATPGLELTDPARPPQDRIDFARTLAEVYWETGDGPSAVYVARTLIPQPDYTLWRCKRAEQQLMLDYAHACYVSIEEHDRARRVARQQVTFTPGSGQ